MTQTEIDQRETARVEAILQIARWALVEVIEQDGGASTVATHLMAAVQWDDPALSESADLRFKVVLEGLDILAEQWVELPDGERDTVLAGLLGEVPAELGAQAWARLVDLAQSLGRTPHGADPEYRTVMDREYARQLRSMTTAVVGA